MEAERYLRAQGRCGRRWNFQPGSAGSNFPYYVLYVGSDINLNTKWTWNFVTFRFRDAFDTSNNFEHPGGFHPRLTFKIDDGRSVFATYYYGWKEGSPDYQGIGAGFKYSF